MYRHGDQVEFGDFRTINGKRYKLYSAYRKGNGEQARRAAMEDKKWLKERHPTIKVRVLKSQYDTYAIYIYGGDREV